jgi:hypothetical protein
MSAPGKEALPLQTQQGFTHRRLTNAQSTGKLRLVYSLTRRQLAAEHQVDDCQPNLTAK